MKSCFFTWHDSTRGCGFKNFIRLCQHFITKREGPSRLIHPQGNYIQLMVSERGRFPSPVITKNKLLMIRYITLHNIYEGILFHQLLVLMIMLLGSVKKISSLAYKCRRVCSDFSFLRFILWDLLMKSWIFVLSFM